MKLALGIVKAQGLYTVTIQAALRQHCEQGRIAEVAELVAQALFDQALVEKTLPEPKGVMTPVLRGRMLDGAKHLAETYARRGVLCAKGYYPVSQLVLQIVKLWESSFSNIVDLSSDDHLLREEDPDYATRCTVAASSLLGLLDRLERNGDGSFVLPMKDVEGFCMTAVRQVHAALKRPDIAVHQMLHNETVEPT